MQVMLWMAPGTPGKQWADAGCESQVVGGRRLKSRSVVEQGALRGEMWAVRPM